MGCFSRKEGVDLSEWDRLSERSGAHSLQFMAKIPGQNALVRVEYKSRAAKKVQEHNRGGKKRMEGRSLRDQAQPRPMTPRDRVGVGIRRIFPKRHPSFPINPVQYRLLRRRSPKYIPISELVDLVHSP